MATKRRPASRYMATSDPPADGTPPAVRATADTLEEIAGLFLTQPGLTQVRVVDDTHPEYGEGVVTVRRRGQQLEVSDPQLYLGGRPLAADEQAQLMGVVKELQQFVKRYGLPLGIPGGEG